MDVTASGLRTEVEGIIANGEPIRFRYFTVSGADSGYDDDVTLVQSGTDFWVSGLLQPLNIENPRGSKDAVLLEQGKIKQDDLKLYVLGTVNTSGTLRIGIGSANPPTNEYRINDGGVTTWTLGNQDVYKKLYVSYLTTGSIDGE